MEFLLQLKVPDHELSESQDVETIDQDIAMTLTFFLLEVLGVMAIIITIAAVLPAFLIAAFFITLAYWLIGYIYLASSRELKRTGRRRSC